VGKNLKIYSLLVYRVNFILYCSVLTLLMVGTILAYSVMQIEQRELKKKRGGGKTYSFVYLVMKNNLNKSLREKEVEKKEYIYLSAN
jgi:hypothetical protein